MIYKPVMDGKLDYQWFQKDTTHGQLQHFTFVLNVKMRKTIDIPDSTLSRFDEIYPMHGSFTWFVNAALENFVKLHEIKPGEIVTEAVNEVLNLNTSEES